MITMHMLFCFTACGRPLRAPLHGSFETGWDVIYQVIIFYCDPGYIIIGYPVFTCSSMGSRPTPPECRPMNASERACPSLSNPRQGRVTYYKDRNTGITSALYTCQMTSTENVFAMQELVKCLSTCVNGYWHPPQLLDCSEVKALRKNYSQCGMDNTTVHREQYHWELDGN